MFTCISSTIGPLKVFKNQLFVAKAKEVYIGKESNELEDLIREICMEIFDILRFTILIPSNLRKDLHQFPKISDP